MRKVSLKTVLHAVFYALTALVMSVCLAEPINLKVFVEDPKVSGPGGIIERGQEKVSLVEGSEGKAGPGKITGLDPDKYYMIERWDEDEGDEDGNLPDSTDVRFVSAAGALVEFTGIGRLNGSEITGLTNNNIYMVTSAKPLPKENFSLADGIDGAVTLPDTANGTTMTLYNLSGKYVMLPETPAITSRDVSAAGITLNDAGTTTDYVFYNEALGRNSFYELQVKINPAGTNLTITLTAYDSPTDGIFNFSDPTGNIAWSDDPASQTVNVTVAAPLNTGTWYFNGVSLGTALNNTAIDTYNATATDNEKIDLTAADKSYEFTYEASIDGKLFSAPFTIKIGLKP